MSNVNILYEVQVREGSKYVELEREIGVNAVPQEGDLVDFTPLGEKEDERLLFRVMGGRRFCHAEVGYRERVRVRIHSIHAGSSKYRHLEPGPDLLEEHGFKRVRAN